MKTGAIVYVTGADDQGDFDVDEAVRKLTIKANRVEVVLSGSSHFDIMDAWWLLTTKGMQEIICLLAIVKDQSEVVLTGRELRLCG